MLFEVIIWIDITKESALLKKETEIDNTLLLYAGKENQKYWKQSFCASA